MDRAPRAMWSSRLAFLLAAIGAAIGLGNIWKFPYMAGANGGGAFVVVYLVCVVAVAVPILMAELLIGRRGRRSAGRAVALVAAAEGAHGAWAVAGWMGVAAAFLILTFYSVIAGWALAYVPRAIAGSFVGQTPAAAAAAFDALVADPIALTAWHTLFMLATTVIVARGLEGGIERAVLVMMPALFAMILLLVGYAGVAGDFAGAVRFLFAVSLAKIDPTVVLMAVGQAFFSVGVAMAIMMTYAAYLPSDVGIPRAALVIAAADTMISLLAGLAIFPLVLANGLDPGEGPGLIFVTLPLAFGAMPAGAFFGAVFFVLLVFAALSTSIAFLEAVVRWVEERGVGRARAAAGAGLATWVVGLGSVLSFNRWADVHPLGGLAPFAGKTIFDLLDYLTTNVLVTVAGLLLALFAGWAVTSATTRAELGLADGVPYRLWLVLVRFVAPVAIAAILVTNLV